MDTSNTENDTRLVTDNIISTLKSITLDRNEHKCDFKQAETQVKLGECEVNSQKQSVKTICKQMIEERWVGGMRC